MLTLTTKARLSGSCLSLLLLLPAAGCKKPVPPSPTGGTEAGKGGVGDKTLPLAPVGMADPFARLGGPAGKALDRGYKALRAKKYDEAAAAFAEVAAAAPDSTASRFQLARALVMSGKVPEGEKELEQVLSRDFVAYAGRADKPKEWKALRDAPEWAAYKEAEGRYKAAYAQGLGNGFVFVARNRPAKTATDKTDIKLDLSQEVYHHDPATGRYRRLTATDGHVFAALRSQDGKMLAFVAATRQRKTDGGDVFVDPQGGYVDLATLETVGPFKIVGTFFEVSIGFGDAGRVPAWQTEITPGADGGTFVIDTAHTGMTKSDVALQGERTWAQVQQVWNSGKGSPQGVTLSVDKKSFGLEGGGTVTSARELSDSSLDFSPSRKRITYAGKLDACKVLSGDKSKNELFVYDLDKKSAQRIDSGISKFETQWLDDNLLVYENGIGPKGTVNLYDLSGHKKTSLSPHYGAGIYGIPTLSCQAAPEPDEVPEEQPAEDAE